ncbi:MAG: amidase [Acidobacteria bacterium]|nr:amidase [Acidobacteriota bacterium]
MSLTRRNFLAASSATVAWAAAPAPGDVFFASLTELSARLRKKEFSCVELTRAFADRLERLGPRYNALALSLRAPALKLAKDVDDEIKWDRLRSPLQGVPYGAKDLFAVEKRVTAWGAKPFATQVFDYDATVIRKLAKAKAPLLGKLAMVELAGGPSYGGPSASVTGPCLNPWDVTRWAGGSSSGSGAAVAAGLVPWALGTETSGSILTPSAFCGVTGLRPTYGLVSRYGAMELSHSLDKIGPMCRTAEDCGHVLAVIAGGDDNDPYSAGKSFYFAPEFVRPLKELRVGFAPVDFDVWADEAARPAFQAALGVFRQMGVTVVEKKLPELPYGPTVRTLIMAEGSTAFRPLIESGKVDELADKVQIEGLKNGLKVTAADYLKAKTAQREITGAFGQLFSDVDVLIAPARLRVADEALKPFDNTPAPPRSPDRGNTALIGASNVAGVPALSLPCGLVGGLPVGIQLVGRHFTENTLLALGMEFQRRTEWHKQHPVVS